MTDAPLRRGGFRLESVSVRFGAEAALDGVDLEIAPGECVAFVGPSGAGKTTLLRVLNTSQRPTSGRLLLDGEPLGDLHGRRLRAVRSRLGTVHQDLRLVPNLRVLQNVLAGRLGQTSLLGALRFLVAPPRREVERVHALLERVGIGHKLYERTDRLSGGQRQRVAIARALYQRPVALLPDEPISSLDPARSREVMALLVDLCREEGLTLCVSLHDLEIARELTPRLVGLRSGRIVFDRPSAELADADFARLYDLAPADG
ncbi:MAG: phosphonate ABC transporter ATP-binding protein [Acidobacteriota bacterium]